MPFHSTEIGRSSVRQGVRRLMQLRDLEGYANDPDLADEVSANFHQRRRPPTGQRIAVRDDLLVRYIQPANVSVPARPIDVMNLSLLIQICGLPLITVIVVTSLILTLAACYLAFSVKQEDLLVAFLPLTALPAIAALFATFTGTLSSIGLQLDSGTDVAVDAGFILQMNLVPLLVGLLAAVPAALIASFGRWFLAWRASGILLWGQSQPVAESEMVDADEWITKETDDYLSQLTRPR